MDFEERSIRNGSTGYFQKVFGKLSPINRWEEQKLTVEKNLWTYIIFTPNPSKPFSIRSFVEAKAFCAFNICLPFWNLEIYWELEEMGTFRITKKQVWFLFSFFVLAINYSFVSASPPLEFDKIYLNNKSILQGRIIKISQLNVEFDPIGDSLFQRISRDSIAVIILKDNTVISLHESSSDENKVSQGVKSFSDFSEEFVLLEMEIQKASSQRRDYYEIEEVIAFSDPNNSNEKEISLKGGFSVIQTWPLAGQPKLQIENFFLELEILGDEETFTFDEKYKLGNDEVLVDGYEEIEIGPYEADLSWTISDIHRKFGGEFSYKFGKLRVLLDLTRKE